MKGNIISFDIEGSEELKEAVSDFIEFRKERKKPLTCRGFELFMKKLDKLADDEETKIKIIEQSIERSWLGIFPLHFDVDEKEKAKVKPSGFNNFTQEKTNLTEISKRKREELYKKAGRLNEEQ